MPETKDLEQLLNNIQKGLKKYSVKELNEAIVTIINKKHNKTREIDFIFEKVSSKFDVPIAILKAKGGTGKVQDAKQICYCLLHFDLGLSIRYIAEQIFFNWPTSVWVGTKRLKGIDLNVKTEIEFHDAYQNLQLKLINFITIKKEKV